MRGDFLDGNLAQRRGGRGEEMERRVDKEG